MGGFEVKRGTKNPATPPHPRPPEKTQVSPSDLDPAETEPATRSAPHALFLLPSGPR